MTPKKVLLFDMDLIAYRAAAVSEERSIIVKHHKTGIEKAFNTRTEFKDLLKSKDKTYVPEHYEIRDVQKAHPISYACQIVKSQINSIKGILEPDNIECFIGGKGNFRLDLDLPEVYKGNRTDMLRPILLDETKKYCLDNYPGKLVEGCEVDDYVVIRYWQLRQAGHDPIIITLDKDQKGCLGTKFFNWTLDNPEVQEVPIWGYLTYDKENKKVQGIGLHFYCYQMLKGDTSDNYSPGHLHKKRFGDVEVVKYINQANTPDEMFKLVEDKYKEWFHKGETYRSQTNTIVKKDFVELLNMYHACVYMLRKENDTTTFYDLWEEFKLNDCI